MGEEEKLQNEQREVTGIYSTHRYSQAYKIFTKEKIVKEKEDKVKLIERES